MNLDKVISFLDARFEAAKPLFHIDKVTRVFYDSGTNNVLLCSHEETRILTSLKEQGWHSTKIMLESSRDDSDLVTALFEIYENIEKFNILGLFPDQVEFAFAGDHLISEHLGESVQSVTLEVTESCNLRCGYCVYNGTSGKMRGHGKDAMSIATAKKAIDLIASRKVRKRAPGVAFYGGEPLVAFGLIRDVVEYAKSVLIDDQPVFTLTTNGTILTPEMIDFFILNQFNVMVSLDGPMEIHDAYRIDKAGKGTFVRVIDNLKKLHSAFASAGVLHHLSIHGVFAPPLDEEHYARVISLWESEPWLREIRASLSQVSLKYAPRGINLNSNSDISYRELLERDYFNAPKVGPYKSPLIPAAITKKYAGFFKRPVSNEPFSMAHPNGCCVPAEDRIYVRRDGSIQICNQMSKDAPDIGTVESGINRVKLKRLYADDYLAHVNNKCRNCWACKICSLCYLQGFESGQWDFDARRKYCESELAAKTGLINDYVKILLRDNTALDHLNDVHFV